MGGKGLIEKTLKEVFGANLLPQIAKWVQYGSIHGDRVEQSLLRHTLNHLSQLVEEDGEFFFPEEVYLHPVPDDTLRTGKIAQEIDGDRCFVILSPACDLAIRDNGEFKTDRLLITEIEGFSKVEPEIVRETKSAKKINKLLFEAFNNNHTSYRHWLPKTEFFQGGFINFRRITAHTKEEFDRGFVITSIQIAPAFVKDIVSRFSSYYARQGQPSIDCGAYLMDE